MDRLQKYMARNERTMTKTKVERRQLFSNSLDSLDVNFPGKKYVHTQYNLDDQNSLKVIMGDFNVNILMRTLLIKRNCRNTWSLQRNIHR